jgi:hypothetical protein|tara:strand:+ start:2183 stop:3040 length:858 start_codon:yes stop_codon:yes gene_type:complete
MKKSLVVAGCSYTANSGSWAVSDYWKDDYSKVINLAIAGTGNHVISTRVIEEVDNLLNGGVKPKQLDVIIQWTGLYRLDTVVPKKDNVPRSISSLPMPYKLEKKKSDNIWVTDASRTGKSIWRDLYRITSDEQFFISTLENILRTQWYLKSKKIKYVMFTAWDIFTYGKKPNKESHQKEIVISGNQFSDKIYNNINNDLVTDSYTWSSSLWDMIDWDNFWTFENDKVKYGGMLQWIQNTLPKNWYVEGNDNRGVRDFHPSSEAHKKFANTILTAAMDIINSENNT